MQRDEVLYWLWLQRALGVGAGIKDIIEVFGSPKELFESTVIDWRISGVLSDSRIDRLSSVGIDDVTHIVQLCEKNGWDIITYADARYPQRLREIENPPAVLYVCGRMPNLDGRTVISIVGTRKASPYGVKSARLMAKGIAAGGAVVVSGGALGVDSAAHTGALEAGGLTCVILGSPLTSDYLRQNSELRKRVIQSGGALITEFPPYFEVRRNNFPLRNRIISGLADGVVIVEAGVKSGSTITADYAKEQGRDVFAIPSSILDINFCGTNFLLENGAYPATSPKAVLSHYADTHFDIDLSKVKSMYELLEEERGRKNANAAKPAQVTFDNVPKERKERLVNQQKIFELSANERLVYDALKSGAAYSGEIADKVNQAPSAVSAALTMLEMKGLVTKISGNRYVPNDDE